MFQNILPVSILILYPFCSTARLRGVHDGLFTGQIDAVDTSAATYRVTFDRSGLGTHTVPDFEVLVKNKSFCLYFYNTYYIINYRTVSLTIAEYEIYQSTKMNSWCTEGIYDASGDVFQSNEPNETMPISAFAQKHRTTRYMQNLMTPPRGPYPSATTPVLMVLST